MANMQRRHLGARLKAAREAAGLSGADLARKLVVQPATISRWETGARTPGTNDLRAYLEAVGADQETMDDLLRTEHQVEDGVWVTWSRGTDRRRHMAALMQAEEQASRIIHAAPNLVPGLLQTAGYARKLMLTADMPDAEIRQRVAERLGRRTLLESRQPPPQLDVLLDEAVLRRQLGGVDVLKEQLAFLVERSRLDFVNLMLVPFTAEVNPLGDGQFVLIEFDGEDPVIYEETHGISLFFNEANDVAYYRHVIETAREQAMSPEESREFIAALVKELEER